MSGHPPTAQGSSHRGLLCILAWSLYKLPQYSPELTSEKKLEIFLTGLALRNNVAASTQNQAFNAVLFFYKDVLGQPLGNVDALRAKRPVHERHAPSVSDTRLLLRTFRNVAGYLIIPSARYSTSGSHLARAAIAGCFTYEPPPGVIWTRAAHFSMSRHTFPRPFFPLSPSHTICDPYT